MRSPSSRRTSRTDPCACRRPRGAPPCWLCGGAPRRARRCRSTREAPRSHREWRPAVHPVPRVPATKTGYRRCIRGSRPGRASAARRAVSGRVLRDAERERGVDAPIDVGELDFEGKTVAVCAMSLARRRARDVSTVRRDAILPTATVQRCQCVRGVPR